MIKKYILAGFTMLITSIGISNAMVYNIGTEYAKGSTVENGFNVKYVYLNTTTNVEITEPFFAFKNSNNNVMTKYWWQSDGLYYSKQNYGNTQKKNGKILGYFVCPATYFESTTTYNKYLKDVSGCTYTEGYEGINTYLQGLTNWNYTFNTTSDNNWSIVCAKKEGNDNKVCFDMSYVSVLASADLTYANIRERATTNPYYITEEETPSGTNNNNYFCPTLGQVLKNYGKNYNTGLCYNSTLYYDGTSMQTIAKKSIFENFTNYEEYTNRISIYWSNCTAPATTTSCQNAFNEEFEKYSIIANAINSNIDEKNLWNYCNIGLNYDLNATTCVASGYIAEKPTIEEITNEIINDDSTTILTPGTGTIFDNMNIGQGTGLTYEDIATRDVFGNITQIYDKITKIFEGRNGVNGIIPDYILWLIFVILFFTVLMKK